MRVFYDIANDRSGIKSTLVTSQKDPRRWAGDMGISALGEAVAGRLSGNALPSS